jgi:hypothetical protein
VADQEARLSTQARNPLEWIKAGSVPAYKAVRSALAEQQIAIPTSTINAVLDALNEMLDPRCRGTLGDRPSWMSPDQFDPCRCTLPRDHEGAHACEHTEAEDAR